MKGSVNIGGVKDLSESPLRALSGPPKCELTGEKDITYNFDVFYGPDGHLALVINNIFPATGIDEVNPPKPYPHGNWVMDTTYTPILPVSGTAPVRFGMAQIVDFNARLNIGHAADFFSEFLVENNWSRILLGSFTIHGIEGTTEAVRYYVSWPIVQPPNSSPQFIGPDLTTIATIDFSRSGVQHQRSIIPEQANHCESYFVPRFFSDIYWISIVNNFSQFPVTPLVITSADTNLYLDPHGTKIGTLQMRFRRTATIPLFQFSVGAGTSLSFSNKTFFNTSLTPIWDWDFGDGSAHSAAQNPTHSYPSTGRYHVTLTATDPTGEVKTFDQYVDLPLKADFTYTSRPSFSGGPVTIITPTDHSNGAVTWDWDWGDGSPHSTTQAIPITQHVYPRNQVFTITLTVTDGAGHTASISKLVST